MAYLYDATGNKLKQTYNMSGTGGVKTTEFISNFVYENNVLAWVNTPEGRIVFNTNGTSTQEFNIKDHLGNVRVVYSRVSNANVSQQVDTYYPFGMNIKGLTATKTGSTRPNEYLYNGKMMQDEMGLALLDYGKRFYDPVLGRFTGVDPIAEDYNWVTTYNYAENSPIANIDLWGLQAVNVNALVEKGIRETSPGVSDEAVAKVMDSYQNGQDRAAGIIAPFLLSLTPLDVVVDLVDGVNSAKNGDLTGVGLAALSLVGFDIISDGKKAIEGATDIAAATKKGGRLGGDAHQAKVKEAAAELKSQGFEITGGGVN